MLRWVVVLVLAWLAATQARADYGAREIMAVAFTPDGRTVLTAGRDGCVRYWDVARQAPQLEVRRHRDGVDDLALSLDGKRFATAGGDRCVRIWDVAKVKEIYTLPGHASKIESLALSPDGKLLASGSPDGLVLLREVETGKVRHRLLGHGYRVTTLAFSPDGKTLASGGIEMVKGPYVSGPVQDDRIRLWDVRTGKKEVLSLRGQVVAFTPDSWSVAASGRRLSISKTERSFDVRFELRTEIWNRSSSSTSPSLNYHAYGLVLSADGKYLATAWGVNRQSGSMRLYQESRGIHLWERATGKQVLAIEVPREAARFLALCPDGRTLVASHKKGTLAFHSLTPQGWVRRPSLTDKQMNVAWEALGSINAEAAYQAIWELSSTGRSAEFLAKRLQPTPPADDRIKKLLADLESDDFAARKKAREEITRHSEALEPYLMALIHKPPSLEVRLILDPLLAGVHRKHRPDVLRSVRGVTVLERIATPQAVGLLKRLAAGAAGAPLTDDARRALGRLAARQPGKQN